MPTESLSLVTGASGFVGYHLARALTARGEKIRVLTRASSRQDNIKALPASLTEVVTGDLNDADSLRKAIAGCDRLYHVAADYRLWTKDPQELYQTNVDGTRKLLEAAVDAKIRKVVYTSSVGALGIPKDGTPGNEKTPVSEAAMIGHYKRSKFRAEAVAREFASKIDLVIVNPSTPIGENDIKPTPTGQIIVDFLNRAMPAFVDTGLNLVDVRDVAEGILLAGERGERGERYILGNRNVSLKEMLELLSSITGIPAPKVQMPYAVAWLAVGIENIIAERILRQPPKHPFEGVKMAKYKMYFDASKAVRVLGIPQTPIEEPLRRAVNWFQDNDYVRK